MTKPRRSAKPAPPPPAAGDTGDPPASRSPALLDRYPEHALAARLRGPELAENPADWHQRLRREHGPVAPILLDGGVPAWLVLGYREVRLAAENPQLFGRDSRRWNLWDDVPPDWSLLPYVSWTPALSFTEGSEHHRRAGAVTDALDAVHRAGLAAVCHDAADQLIDAFAGAGAADLVAQYTRQLPALVLARLFGLPAAESAELGADIAASVSEGEAANTAHRRILLRIQRLVAAKREWSGPDLPSRLLAHPAGLTGEEVVADLLMIAAGQQITAAWIGNALRLMLVDDIFSVNLQGGRSSAAQALNEVLWHDTPAQNFIGRWAARDCELGGRRLRQGDLLVLGLAAANTDPQIRPDAAAAAMSNRAHLSFGHGEHGCPYPAPEFAEIIARTAIEVLLDRIPDLELADSPGSLRWLPSVWVRSLAALPVRFTPAPAAA